MIDRVYNVLFVCTANSARSIIGECALNHLGGGRFRAFSAGSHPASHPHPLALDLLERRGVPTVGVRSKSWDEFCDTGAPVLDFVLIVCARSDDEYLPAWAGNPIVSNWCLRDPAAVRGTDDERRAAFDRTYEALEHRLQALVCLPLDGASRAAKQGWVDAIGALSTGQELPAHCQAAG
jgi:arsenate reductase